MKILIAEDQPTAARLLRRLLERLGQEVTVVNDGDEAWRVAEQTWFPLIISDWVMPGLNGLDLCRQVRKQKDRSYTYLILLTSKDGQEERLEGLRAGADDLLVKPLSAEELAVRLEIASRIIAVQDELERRNRLLADMARHDELTGVSNRRRFREIFEVDFKMATRKVHPLSLLMIDVDQFKQYNDAFGHPSGDEVLRKVAALLRDGVQNDGEVARYGGEEFAILLPNTGVFAAKAREPTPRVAGTGRLAAPTNHRQFRGRHHEFRHDPPRYPGGGGRSVALPIQASREKPRDPLHRSRTNSFHFKIFESLTKRGQEPTEFQVPDPVLSGTRL